MASDRIKVVLYGENLWNGGAERVLANLASHLDRSVFDITVILNTDRVGYAIPSEVPVVVLGGEHKRTKRIRLLAKVLQEIGPAAMISNLTSENLVALSARSKSKQSFALVCVEHTTISAAPPESDLNLLERLGLFTFHLKRRYTLADAVVCVSHASADDLAEYCRLPRANIRVIYNPVIPPDIEARGLAPLDHPWLDDPALDLVVGVGRLDPDKNFSALIEAFALLAPDKPNLRLVIIGEGQLRGALEARAAALGVLDRVSLPGFVANPFPFMRQASAFVLPSHREGLSNVLVEAMAAGAPVVATDSPGGNRELLESGRFGFLVPVDDPAALAKGIASAMESVPDVDAVGDRVRDFEVTAAAARYGRLIEQLVSGGR